MVIKFLRFFTFLLLTAYWSFGQKNYKQLLPKTEQSISMVFLPGGTFNMGSTPTEKGHFADEAPKHEVLVDSFWIGEYEITWDIYTLFMVVLTNSLVYIFYIFFTHIILLYFFIFFCNKF